jgi:hypothetical protein
VAFSRRSVTAIATLVAYLAGIVGGGLHHHHAQYERHAGTEALGQRADHPGVWAASCGEDEDGCAVCAAIHQAKAPLAAAAALSYGTLTAEVVTASRTEPPLPFHAPTRARGPPLS